MKVIQCLLVDGHATLPDQWVLSFSCLRYDVMRGSKHDPYGRAQSSETSAQFSDNLRELSQRGGVSWVRYEFLDVFLQVF